jgi:hypothetical protein
MINIENSRPPSEEQLYSLNRSIAFLALARDWYLLNGHGVSGERKGRLDALNIRFA